MIVIAAQGYREREKNINNPRVRMWQKLCMSMSLNVKFLSSLDVIIMRMSMNAQYSSSEHLLRLGNNLAIARLALY
jgi:hypothetical protein